MAAFDHQCLPVEDRVLVGVGRQPLRCVVDDRPKENDRVEDLEDDIGPLGVRDRLGASPVDDVSPVAVNPLQGLRGPPTDSVSAAVIALR